MQGTDIEWSCAICLSSEICDIGLNSRQQIRICHHSFHLGCIQQHFIIKNEVWQSNEDFVLQCPLCRSETRKLNWGVQVIFNQQSQQLVLRKSNPQRVKQLEFKITMYGKDVFNRDIKKAKQMLQKVANLCFDVESYWMVADSMPLDLMNNQYADVEKKCAKLITLPTQNDLTVYIERSYSTT